MRLVVNATSYGAVPGGAGLRARELFGALMERGKYRDLLFLLAAETHEWVVPPGADRRRLELSRASRLRRWQAVRSFAEGDLLCCDHFPVHPRIPTIVTLHDCGLHPWRRLVLGRGLRRAAAVVAVSETVGRAWPSLETTVIPNGVVPPAGEMPLPGEHLLLCDPGLTHKGAVFAREVARRSGRSLREVGRGVGWLSRDSLWRELAAAAVVLCPSTDEGFGMVPLEALAQGRPVVASDIPAHREVLGDAALLVAPDDIDGWCLAVDRALAEAPRRAQAGIERAQTYSWAAAAARLEELIGRLATSHKDIAEVDQAGEDRDDQEPADEARGGR